MLILLAVIYGMGEFIRRKYGHKSLMFNNTNDNEVRQVLLTEMRTNPQVSILRLADKTGLSQDHIIDYAHALKKAGQITFEGSFHRKVRWMVTTAEHSTSGWH